MLVVLLLALLLVHGVLTAGRKEKRKDESVRGELNFLTHMSISLPAWTTAKAARLVPCPLYLLAPKIEMSLLKREIIEFVTEDKLSIIDLSIKDSPLFRSEMHDNMFQDVLGYKRTKLAQQESLEFRVLTRRETSCTRPPASRGPG